MEAASTQQYLKISQIRDNTVVLTSGELRQVIEASSVNFSLKSTQEQNAIIGSYQGFLNSLQFPIQIVMHSRRLDLGPYIGKMEKLFEEQQNPLIRIQTADYIDFIKRLITIANIMDKKFYVVVPYLTALIPSSASGGLFSLRQKGHVRLSDEKFKKAKAELDDRTRVIQSGLGSVSLKAEILNTQQLVELYYGLYNQEEAPREHIAEKPEDLTTTLVSESPQSAAEIKQATPPPPTQQPIPPPQTNPPAPAAPVSAASAAAPPPTAAPVQPNVSPPPASAPSQPMQMG